VSQIVIGIHGLGNHPPQRLLRRWWKKSIREGLRSEGLRHPFLRFELAYWADTMHPQPLDPRIRNPAHPLFLSEPYEKGKVFQHGKSHPLRKKLRDQLKKQLDKILLKQDMTLNLSTVTDLILRKYFRDLQLYYSPQSVGPEHPETLIRDQVRNRVAEVIRRHQDKEILLIAHSMGSIIAYDILTRTAPELSVDVLVTIGSPLGLPVVMCKVYSEQKQNCQHVEKVKTPPGVRSAWYNLSDLDDRVAIDCQLAGDYGKNERGVEVIDRIVHNNYEYGGKRNPHKSYGYLRTPETAEIIDAFLNRGRSRVFQWLAGALSWKKKSGMK